MLQKQENYLNELKNLKEKFSAAEIDTGKIDFLQKLVTEQEILVPVVGDFSAGKSTLLNSFIGNEKKILPTAITPETSIATELRYGVDERIEAVDENGNVVKTYGINDFEEINKNAEKYAYLRLYVQNENIRSIEPLVLVDMPGFESPLDAHNMAIQKYLDKGAHFIVLVSATDGTLHATSIRHLNDILEYERDFSVVLSKSNLVPKDNLESVSEKVREDIDDNFDLDKTPVCIGLDGGKALKDIVAELNPEILFDKLVKPSIKDIVYQLESSVNVKISAFHKNTSANDETIIKLKKSLEKITEEEANIRSKAKSNYVENHTRCILDGIGQDLSSSVDSITEIALKKGADSLGGEIQEIVKSSLIRNVKKSIRDISTDINSRFSVELQELNSQMSEYCGEDDFIKRISENSLAMLNDSKTSPLKEIGDFIGSKAYVALTGLLAIVTSVLAPVIEVLIVVVPSLIKKFFEKKEEEKKREELRSKILSDVIPEVKRSLESKVHDILEENIEKIISEISERYSVIISEKQKEIENAENERAKKAEKIQEFVAVMNEAKSCVTELSKKIFAK